MRTINTRFRIGRVVLGVATALSLVSLVVVSTGSVSAQPSGISEATITIEGGALGITVPTGPVDLGTFINVVGAGSVTGELGVVTVSDARSAASGASWEASGISSAFTSAPATAIPASAVGYSPGEVDKVGTAVFVTHEQPDLTAVVPVVVASAITGDNSATWTPEITVLVPADTVAATYVATITHSVL